MGPKTRVQSTISRQIPTPDNLIIHPEYVPLLQHAYSLRGNRIACLIKFLAINYGEAISQPSLRHALLALSANLLPASQFQEQRDYHAQEACRILGTKLSKPDSINEADAFTSFILSYATNKRSEIRTHLRGCESIVHQQSRNAHSRQLTDLLTIFGPMLTDDAINYSIHTLTPLVSRTSFPERVKYFQHLSWTGRPKEVWQFPALDAATYSIDRILSIAEDCILINAVLQESEDTQIHRIQYSLNEMNQELADENLQVALENIKRRCCHIVVFKTLEQQVLLYNLLVQISVSLMQNILRSATIFDGFNDPETQKLAETLFTTWITSGARRIDYFDGGYCDQLYLGGLAVSKLECKSSFYESD